MLSEVMTRATCSTSSSVPYERLVNKVNQAHQSDEARTLREALDGVTARAPSRQRTVGLAGELTAVVSIMWRAPLRNRAGLQRNAMDSTSRHLS